MKEQIEQLEKEVNVLENIIPKIIENIEILEDKQKFIYLLDRLNELSILY